MKIIKKFYNLITFYILILFIALTSVFAQEKQLKFLILDNFKIISNCSQVINDDLQRKCYLYNYKKPKFNFFKIQYSNIDTSIKKRLSFKEDKRIPEEYQNKLKNYVHSGYDRGHLAPDASFDINMTILKTTYLTSNIVPETPRVNRYIISKIEKEERDLVKETKIDVYVLTLANYKSKKFDKNMYIPDYIFILIYYKYKNNYQSIAYKIPNTFEKISTKIINYKVNHMQIIKILKENNIKITRFIKGDQNVEYSGNRIYR